MARGRRPGSVAKDLRFGPVWLENRDKEKSVLACRTKVAEGMKIERVADEIEIVSS